MPNLIAKKTTYEFALEDMEKLIAAELNVQVSTVTVEYVIQEVGGDCMDRGGYDKVTKIRVTVDETKRQDSGVYDR